MLTKRIIPCLDVVNGCVTKAVQFQDNIPVAPAVEIIHRLYTQGVDEVIFFDILASAEKRSIDIATHEHLLDREARALLVGVGEARCVLDRDIEDAVVRPTTLAVVGNGRCDLEHDDRVGLDESAHAISGSLLAGHGPG